MGKHTPAEVGDIIRRLQTADAKPSAIPSPLEQLTIIKLEEPTGWSDTHTWPWVRSTLMDLKLIRQVSSEVMREGRYLAVGYRNVTEFTDLGREVRAAIAKVEAA